MERRWKIILLAVILCATAYPQVRVKDVAKIQGLHDTQLIGYGLVVGLDGTGDGSRTMFTVQSIINMLKNMGIEIPNQRIRVKNVAAVMVTATLKPFVKKGALMDVVVSSMGDAKSLEGGTLLLAPLQSPNGDVLAIAQGPVSTGGYRIEDLLANRRAKNHVAVAAIPSGAVVEKEVKTNELSRELLRLELASPDFSSAVALAKALNTHFSAELARPEDAATVAIAIPDSLRSDSRFFAFVSEMEKTSFVPDRQARVVVNEKTGTIVAGGDVSIAQVAVSHGGITIEVQTTPLVSQPPPFSQGQTTTVPLTQQQVVEKKTQMVVLGPTTNVSELAQALNQLGVAARDVIAIFQAIKRAGALQAELVVI